MNRMMHFLCRESQNMVLKIGVELYSEKVAGLFTDLDTKGLYYIGKQIEFILIV